MNPGPYGVQEASASSHDCLTQHIFTRIQHTQGDLANPSHCKRHEGQISSPATSTPGIPISPWPACDLTDIAFLHSPAQGVTLRPWLQGFPVSRGARSVLCCSQEALDQGLRALHCPCRQASQLPATRSATFPALPRRAVH